MTRRQLAERLAARAGLGNGAARAALDALFGTPRETGIIAAALHAGERVQLAGFGTFAVRQRAARPGFDPRTRTRIVLPAGRAPRFRAGALLRAVLRDASPGAGGDKDETAASR